MWFKIHSQQVELHIFAKPNAKKTAFVKITDQKLHIMLHAKPHHGEANQELLAYLAKLLQTPKKQIILKQGEQSRHKKIIVPLTPTVQQLLDNPNKFFK